MRKLQLKQTLWLIVLTIVYLTFELGFNARLLDVVGAASPDDVHRIEIYGRTLSGIAAALVVLQLMLRYRARNDGKPGWTAISIACAVTVAIVYIAIQSIVDYMVLTRDAEFRRMSVNSVLLQRSLVEGRLQLAGLVDDDAIFAQPEGKAFLALFPFLAVSVDHLDEKTQAIKDQLLKASIRNAIGGVQSYHNQYKDVLEKTYAKWQRYARIPAASDGELRRQQDKAWNDYTRSLARHGWTPSSVPPNRRAAVIKKVRNSAPVPPNWDTSDEATFRDAVEQRYRRTMSASARAVTVGDDRIPPGLSYTAFVARPGVQSELRSALSLPPNANVATNYRSRQEFEPLFEQAVSYRASKEIGRYEAKREDFEVGGKHHEFGVESARAAIVPPVALFFSLLGAIGHFSKLLYLIATAFLLLFRSDAEGKLSRRSAWAATGVLVLVFAGMWSTLSALDNQITRSDLFRQMIAWIRDTGDGATAVDAIPNNVLVNIVHVVAVGQGYSYPFNERIRTQVLQGMEYGYRPQK